MSASAPPAPVLALPDWEEAAAPRPAALDGLLAPGQVAPRYEGRSIANLPATIGALLEREVGDLPPLEEGLWRPLAEGGLERVLVLMVDALGYRRLVRELEQDQEGRAWLADQGATLAPLTAIFPSTTTATLSTLWTGRSPLCHGLLGYKLWLRETGVVTNMIGLRPARRALDVDLVKAGLLPLKRFLPGHTVAQQLTMRGTSCHVLLHRSLKRSGLSRMLFQGCTSLSGFASLGDSFVRLRELLERTARQRGLIAAYWDDFDLLAHARGPDDEAWSAEWSLFFPALRRLVFDRLSERARRRTAVALVADHGQVRTRPEAVVPLEAHPALGEALALPPTGEPRATYLHLRPGARDEARAYLREALGEAFLALDVEEAIEAGLWGPGPPHPEARRRLGDLVLLARGPHTLVPRDSVFRTQGRHGALEPDEAVVPWLAWRLG